MGSRLRRDALLCASWMLKPCLIGVIRALTFEGQDLRLVRPGNALAPRGMWRGSSFVSSVEKRQRWEVLPLNRESERYAEHLVQFRRCVGVRSKHPFQPLPASTKNVFL